MARLSNPSSPREWQRLCLGGLAASLVLHLLALDLWRGLGGPGERLPVPVKAKLSLYVAPLLPSRPVQAAVIQRTETTAAMPGREVRVPAARHGAAGLAVAAAVPFDSPGVVSPEPKIALRPLSMAEARVAYRLALLMANDEPWPALPEAGVLLELALGADGRPEAARLLRESGDAQMDQAWLRRLQSAARRAELPIALQGKAFALELEFLP